MFPLLRSLSPRSVSGRRCVLALFVFTLAALSKVAWAHHGNSLGRVGDGMGALPVSTANANQPLPRLELSLDAQTTPFNRVLLGSAAYTEAELGSVTLNVLQLGLAVELASRTRLSLLMPLGLLTTETPNGSKKTEPGLGDLKLSVQQELWSNGSEARVPAALAARLGSSAPSGNYDPEARLSLIDASQQADGSFALVSYDNQASLGSDVWSLSAGLEASWKFSPSIETRLHLDAAAPITDTEDDIRWGYDLRSGPSVRFAPLFGRFGVTLGADYALHGPERVTVLDDETERQIQEHVGGRQQVAMSAALDVRFAQPLSCTVGAWLPLWQRTQGVQLVASYSVFMGCAVSFGL